MEKLEVAEGLGKKIIKSQHDFFEANHIEDLDHITKLKRIIVAISEYLRLEDVPVDKINALTCYFKQASKALYVSVCTDNKDDDEDYTALTNSPIA